MNNVFPYQGTSPEFGKGVWLAPSCNVIGHTKIGANTNIWFQTVVRGDVNTIEIGENTNIQDNTTVHVTKNGGPTFIGSNVTIGHQCTIHACHINDHCLIGMGSVLIDKTIVPEFTMIGANSLVTRKSDLKSEWLHVGNPCRPIRKLTDAELQYLKTSATDYIKTAEHYAKAGIGTIYP